MSQRNTRYLVCFLERADHAKLKLMYSTGDMKTASAVLSKLQKEDPMGIYYIKEVHP